MKLWYNNYATVWWRLALRQEGVIYMSTMEMIALLSLIVEVVLVTYTITKK